MTWKTVAYVGYSHSVNPYNENRSAHGGVCLMQSRKLRGRLQGRYVNSNGGHTEEGEPFDLTSKELENWEAIARSNT